MASNGKALVAAAIAGLMVVGVAYWWNRTGRQSADRAVPRGRSQLLSRRPT